jgi:hypothetical protein
MSTKAMQLNLCYAGMDFWFPNVGTDLNNPAQYEEDNQHDVDNLTGHDEQVTGNPPVSRYNVGPSADSGVFLHGKLSSDDSGGEDEIQSIPSLNHT